MYNPNAYMGREENLTISEQLVYDELVGNIHLEKSKKLHKRLEKAKSENKTKEVEDIKKRIKYKEYAAFFMDEENKIYSQEIIDEDIKKSEEAKESFNEVPTQKSEILEALIADGIEESGWLGNANDKEGEAHSWKTLEYDDYINHVDIIVEMENEDGEIIKLGIDATVGDLEDKITKKINFILADLEKKYGTKVKYFMSSFSNKNGEIQKGAINNFPRVVISCAQETLSKLCNLKKKTLEGGDDMEKTTLQLRIIEEIIGQLEGQLEYLKNKVTLPGNNKIEDLPLYKEIKKNIIHLSKVYKNKKGLVTDPDDQTMQVIKLSQRLF